MIEWLVRMDPRALLFGPLALGALLALPLLIASIDRLSRLRLKSGVLYLLLGILLALSGLTTGLAAASLHTYRRLTHEPQLAATVSMRRLGERQFKLTLAAPGAAPRELQVLGDEWQIDARIVKWRGLAALSEFDAVYRLEELSGRNAQPTRESAARSAQSLAAREPVDVWVLARRFHDYLPFVAAYRRSAGYLPMAEGAEYTVSVSASGLAVQPANEAARRALNERR